MFFAAAYVVFCLVCSVLAFKRHPIYGLYFYLATTFVFPPARWWGYVFGDMRWALLSAGITALAVVFNRGKLKPKPVWIGSAPVVILTLYAVWMWLQTPWALDPKEHIEGSTEFVKCLLALWFVYRVVDTTQRLRDLMLAHVLGCGLLGIYAELTGREGDRLDGVGGPNIDDANTLGMYFVTGAVLAIGLVLSQKGWRRYLSLATLVVIINGFVLANSRGAFLGLVAGSLTLAFCIARQHRGLFWAFAFAGALGLTVIVDQVFVERMFTIEDVTSHDENADMSARSRLAVAEAQLKMFADYPMGTGFRGTAVLSPQYLDRKWLTMGDDGTAARSSHNTFLTALVEQGVPGAAMYAGLVLWLVGAVFRVRRLNGAPHDAELVTLGAALCAGLVAVFTAGTTADYLLKEVQFWLYAGLLSMFWLSGAGSEAGRTSGEAAPLRRAAA